MTRMVFCSKLNRDAEGLASAPFPGALGLRIYEHVSKEAWQMWLSQQTMLINEYRLSMVDPKSREFLVREMENYFFGDGSVMPAGYTPVQK